MMRAIQFGFDFAINQISDGMKSEWSVKWGKK